MAMRSYDRTRNLLRSLKQTQIASTLSSLKLSPRKASPSDVAVTIIVPCYNEGRFISDCLKSLQKQTYKQWVCIVVDDASTDNSLSVAARIAALDPRIQVVRHKINSGLSASRNTGLRLARTSLVTFLDGDDFLLKESLRDRIEVLLANQSPSLAGVYCGSLRAEESAQLATYPSKLSWDPPEFEDLLTTRGDCPFVAHAPLLKTEVLRSAGGFDESMMHGAEDWDLWLRLMRNGYEFKSSKYRTAIYRMKKSSMVREMPLEHLREAKRLLDSVDQPLATEHIYEDSPFRLDEPIARYEIGIRQNKRILEFCGMAADQSWGSVDETLTMFDAPSWPLLKRHHDIGHLIDEGIRRALCLPKISAGSDDASIHDKREQILAKVEDWVSNNSSTRELSPHKSFDLLLAPATAAQVSVMQDLSNSFEQHLRICWVALDREDGDQGAELALDAAKLKWISLNSLLLNKHQWNAIIISRQPGPAASDLAAATQKGGGLVFELNGNSDQLNERLSHLVEAIIKLEPSSIADEDFHTREEYPATKFDGARMSGYLNKHDGERCFIIGNGPSLNDLDLRFLANETTFAVNGIFYASEQMGFDPTYYVVEDSSVMKENLSEIRAFRAGHKFFPSLYRKLYGEDENTTYFMMNRGFYETSSPNYCVPKFSYNAAQRLYCGQSVTHINLQLAYYMGFSEVILIGMDFSYKIPDSAKRSGDLIISTEADPNHFHPDYFGAGKSWKDPKLDRVLANYEVAKLAYENDGRKILNATAGGNLELFERVTYKSLFDSQIS